MVDIIVSPPVDTQEKVEAADADQNEDVPTITIHLVD
jgi:hypothetical protein